MNYATLLRIALLFCFASSCHSAFSQLRTCGFDSLHRQLVRQNDNYRKVIQLNEQKAQQRLRQLSFRGTSTVYRLPVVVHVVHNGEPIGTGSNISDAQIQSAIDALSQHYRGTLGNSVDTDIEFQLAGLDPDCQPTNGIERIDGSVIPGYFSLGLIAGSSGNELAIKDLSRWPTHSYYNIWIVSEINDNNGGHGMQGFAYLPGAPSGFDGAVVLYNAFGFDPDGTLGYELKPYTNRNAVITHEMGHALGLYHTFEGDDSDGDGLADICPSNTTCNSQGDFVCDTDPHQRSVSDCPAGTNSCSGLQFANVVSNYMDYSSETCQDRFTPGQAERMRAYVETMRPGLLGSLGASASYPFGDFSTPVSPMCVPSTGSTGMSGAYSGIMNVKISDRNFSSSDASSDGGYLDGVQCLNLVQLYAGVTYSISITVLGEPNYEQVRAWIDYNNNGVFDNATEQIFYADNIAPVAGGFVTVSGNFTVPAQAMNNTSLRVRVIGELGTQHGSSLQIVSGCYNPVYGQAEDYVARVSSVLPVTLVEFSGRMQGTGALLRWKTSEETNSGLFEIERSSGDQRFEPIGSLTAAGSSRTEKLYSFTDTKPGSLNHYRLKMIDRDGRIKYSSVVVLRNQPAAQQMWVNSNPFREKIGLRFAQRPTTLRLELVNTLGRVVEVKEYKHPSEQLTWNLGQHHPAGFFVLRVVADGEVFSKSLIKE